MSSFYTKEKLCDYEVDDVTDDSQWKESFNESDKRCNWWLTMNRESQWKWQVEVSIIDFHLSLSLDEVISCKVHVSMIKSSQIGF